MDTLKDTEYLLSSKANVYKSKYPQYKWLTHEELLDYVISHHHSVKGQREVFFHEEGVVLYSVEIVPIENSDNQALNA